MEFRVPGWTMESLQDPLMEQGFLPYVIFEKTRTESTDSDALATEKEKTIHAPAHAEKHCND